MNEQLMEAAWRIAAALERIADSLESINERERQKTL